MKLKRQKVPDIISIQKVNTKINGYYSLGIPNKKNILSLPKIELNEPLIFIIKTYIIYLLVKDTKNVAIYKQIFFFIEIKSFWQKLWAKNIVRTYQSFCYSVINIFLRRFDRKDSIKRKFPKYINKKSKEMSDKS